MGWGRSSRLSLCVTLVEGTEARTCCVCGERISFSLLQLTTVACTIMVVSMCIVARGRLTFIIKCTAIRCLQPWAIPRYSSGPRTAYRLRHPVAKCLDKSRLLFITPLCSLRKKRRHPRVIGDVAVG